MGRYKKNYNINMPLSWEEVTLQMFQDLSKLYDNDNKPTITDILAVLTNIEKKELEQYPTEIIETIIKQVQFIYNSPTDKVENQIIIDKERYFINYEDELRFKEFVDSQTLLEGNNRDYASLLAILCRKQGEIYNDEYIATQFNQRREMFLKQPITKILPIVTFFLNYWVVCEKFINRSSTLKIETNKYLDSIGNLLKNGLGKKHTMKSQMKRLQTLKQHLNFL